jgi:hypothetical protein
VHAVTSSNLSFLISLDNSTLIYPSISIPIPMRRPYQTPTPITKKRTRGKRHPDALKADSLSRNMYNEVKEKLCFVIIIILLLICLRRELRAVVSQLAFRHPRTLVHLHVVDQPVRLGERRGVLANVRIAGAGQSCAGTRGPDLTCPLCNSLA